jgi:hypothetical protein
MRVGEIVSGRSRNVSLPTAGTLNNADSHSDGLNGDEVLIRQVLIGIIVHHVAVFHCPSGRFAAR